MGLPRVDPKEFWLLPLLGWVDWPAQAESLYSRALQELWFRRRKTAVAAPPPFHSEAITAGSAEFQPRGRKRVVETAKPPISPGPQPA
jgi:hypothetical protein